VLSKNFKTLFIKIIFTHYKQLRKNINLSWGA